MVRATRSEPDRERATPASEAHGSPSPLELFRAGTDTHLGQTLTRLAALAAQEHLAQLESDRQHREGGPTP